MPIIDPDQGVPLPDGTDLADNPAAFSNFYTPVMSRLNLRYANAAARTALHPAPILNETSILNTSTWYDRWTGSKWIPVNPITVVKTANQIISNSTAFANDTNLFIPIPTPNTTYAIEATIAYVTTAVADIKFQFTVPAGSGYNFGGYGAATAGGVTGDANFSWSTNASYGGSGSDMVAMIQGTLIAGGTAGNLQLQWAQQNLELSNTTVYQRSWLRISAIV